MSADSWDDVERVFADAVELEPGPRAVLLDTRCAGQTALRAEVESLLASHEVAGGFLRVVTVADAPVDPLQPSPEPGRTVGRYRLLEKIGEGGMGVVYLADRADGDFDERVAVKLIAAPFHSADALRRFRVERQALATLNHPDIVTLLDGGLTEAGQAYLAMKYVEGVPITSYCAARTLDIEPRVRLFQRVCAAVQHAHQHGIVHRDLKPANILVAADGNPKLLDFGIAKLIDPAGRAIDATGTIVGHPLTPNYASPEQLRGLPVTTACDVYALGVVLYELLTGARPYETTGKPLDEVLATVVDREPRRPSAARGQVAPGRLKGDLDAIVLKAMSKDPVARYASAGELSEDLARHLAGQPVLAREPSFGYFVGRLARRHRAAFVAAAVSLVALVTAFGVSLWQTQVARAERDRAARRFNDVRHLANALIFKIHDEVQPLAGSTPVRRTIVSEALAYLETLSRDAAADDGLRIELGKAFHRIGAIQGSPSEPNLGDRDAALASLRRAIAVLGPVARDGAGPREANLQLGRSQLSLSMIANILGRRDEAVNAARAATTLAEALVVQRPADDDARRLLGSAHFQVALVLEGDDALAEWLRAEQVFEALLRARPDDPDRQRNVALVNKYVGGVYSTRNDLARALTHYTRALDLDERRLAASPSNRQAQLDAAIDLNQLAKLRRKLGQDREAAASYERSLERISALSESDPNDIRMRIWRVNTLVALGDLYSDLHDSSRAIRSAERAIELGEPIRSVDALHQVYFGEALNLLGRAQRQAGRTGDACAAYRRAALVLRNVKPAELAAASGSNLTAALHRLDEGLRACGAGDR